MDLKQNAYNKAVEVLTHCVKPNGFYASGLKGGYEAVWARDSMVASLGACLVGKQFKEAIKNSIELLAKNQSALGQIPNCVGSYNTDRKSDITFNSIDSSLWFAICNYIYAKIYNDKSLLKKYKHNISQAILWLKYQDPNEDKLLSQHPTMDWQDAFPHKYGRTINTHALYYGMLNLAGENELAEHVKKIINGNTQKYLSLYNEDLGYYLPWAWKNHDGDLEHEEWFDSLGNILAVVTGLADKKISENILNHIDEQKINRPFPCKAIWPYIKPESKEWHSYFSKCNARDPYNYLNAGIWPFIGGFYVVALVKAGQYEKAKEKLEGLAEANMQRAGIRKLNGEYEFNEWLHGKIGNPLGEPYQAWTAGAYIYAYECVSSKKVLFF
ncbi:MAG: amylo-alpha-1,6-glucosidase [Candidatus Falkowbacteria bacterium]